MFLVMLLLEWAIIMFLFSISRKTWVKIPLTILIAWFSILWLSLVLHFLYIDSDILEEIFVPLALSVIVPTTIVTLLKLVRKK